MILHNTYPDSLGFMNFFFLTSQGNCANCNLSYRRVTTTTMQGLHSSWALLVLLLLPFRCQQVLLPLHLCLWCLQAMSPVMPQQDFCPLWPLPHWSSQLSATQHNQSFQVCFYGPRGLMEQTITKYIALRINTSIWKKFVVFIPPDWCASEVKFEFSATNKDNPDRCVLEQLLPQHSIYPYENFLKKGCENCLANSVINCLGPGISKPTQPKP